MKNKSSIVDELIRDFTTEFPDGQELLEKAELQSDVAGEVYRMRTTAGLSQRELAKRVGTTASVISRLESANYEGHSMSMLVRIASALGKRVEVRFVDIKKSA